MKWISPSSRNVRIDSGSLPGCSARVHRPAERSLLAICISSGRLSRMKTNLPKIEWLRISQGLITKNVASTHIAAPMNCERHEVRYSSQSKQKGIMEMTAVFVTAINPQRRPKRIHERRGYGHAPRCCKSSAMRKVSRSARLSKNAVRLVSHTTRVDQE